MTTESPPKPPPGYKLVRGEDIKDRVPDGALSRCEDIWLKSGRIGLNLINKEDLNNHYAIPEDTKSMNTPKPPPGYKLVRGEDIKDQLPMKDLLCWYEIQRQWDVSIYQMQRRMHDPDLDNFYAIPSEPESITDEAKSIDPYHIQIGGVRADPYRVARAYGIDDPVIFQALEKLLCCGRKHKDRATDVREAITSLEYWEQMNKEDEK